MLTLEAYVAAVSLPCALSACLWLQGRSAMPRAGIPKFQIEKVHVASCERGVLRLTDAELHALQQYLTALGESGVEVVPCEPREPPEATAEAKGRAATKLPDRAIADERSTSRKRLRPVSPATSPGTSPYTPSTTHKRGRPVSPATSAGTSPYTTPSPSQRSSSPEGEPMEKPLTEEEEARQQLQRMIDRLDADQLAKLIELNNPARDPKTGEYILGYDQLGADQRESFRRSVEQLLQAQTEEELARQAKEPPEEAVTQKICPKLPVPTVASHEQAVQDMLREFESWI